MLQYLTPDGERFTFTTAMFEEFGWNDLLDICDAAVRYGDAFHDDLAIALGAGIVRVLSPCLVTLTKGKGTHLERVYPVV